MDSESHAAGKVAHLHVREHIVDYAYGHRYIFLEKGIDQKSWHAGYMESLLEHPHSSLRNISIMIKLEGSISYLWETRA